MAKYTIEYTDSIEVEQILKKKQFQRLGKECSATALKITACFAAL